MCADGERRINRREDAGRVQYLEGIAPTEGS